jgi:hypothetical protein
VSAICRHVRTRYDVNRNKRRTSRSSNSGLVRNFAKKYSLVVVSSAISGSRFLFRDPGPDRLLPIMARSLAVASLIDGKTLVTASLNSGKVAGLAKRGGFENGS